ncbi:MAG TPA: hypothetical protein VF884_02525, partial [Nitrososphaeraceae archaeon]
ASSRTDSMPILFSLAIWTGLIPGKSSRCRSVTAWDDIIFLTTVEIFFDTFKVESYKSTGGLGYQQPY